MFGFEERKRGRDGRVIYFLHMRLRSLFLLAFGMVAPFVASASMGGPTISAVSFPSTVMAGSGVMLSAGVNAGSGISSCKLYVDADEVGAMAVSNGVASYSYTFPRGGVFTVFVFCREANGGMASGPNTSILVQGALVNTPSFGGIPAPTTAPAPTTTTPLVMPVLAPAMVMAPRVEGAPAFGSLMKLPCAENALSDDACKAVYYYGQDAKRHAFANSKVFFTWFQGFDSVVEVSPSVLGQIPLGKNIAYRPASRMVKFVTLDKVYVVTRGGMLRWVTSEAVATGLYGTDWNTKIDDIADTFFVNYTFGADILTAAELNLANVASEAPTIDTNW